MYFAFKKDMSFQKGAGVEFYGLNGSPFRIHVDISTVIVLGTDLAAGLYSLSR